jgi:hypothetical protein
MNNQETKPTEQSGKHIALGIFAFIIGTVVVLYLLKVLLF